MGVNNISCASEIVDAGCVGWVARSVRLGEDSAGKSFLRGSVHHRSMGSESPSAADLRRRLNAASARPQIRLVLFKQPRIRVTRL